MSFSSRVGACRRASVAWLHHVWSQDGELNKAAELEVSSCCGNLEELAPQRHKRWPTEVRFDGFGVCVSGVFERFYTSHWRNF